MKYARDRGERLSSPTTKRRSASLFRSSRVTPLREYRRRALRRRIVMRARRMLQIAAGRFLVIPPAFWMGVLTGLIAGALFLAATGHGQLFVRPSVVHVSTPVSFGT